MDPSRSRAGLPPIRWLAPKSHSKLSPVVAAALLGMMLTGPPAPVDMSWEAPDSCPDQATVVARIDELLADTTVDREQAMQARARVRATDDGRWTLSVEIATDDGPHTRELTEGEKSWYGKLLPERGR